MPFQKFVTTDVSYINDVIVEKGKVVEIDTDKMTPGENLAPAPKNAKVTAPDPFADFRVRPGEDEA